MVAAAVETETKAEEVIAAVEEAGGPGGEAVVEKLEEGLEELQEAEAAVSAVQQEQAEHLDAAKDAREEGDEETAEEEEAAAEDLEPEYQRALSAVKAAMQREEKYLQSTLAERASVATIMSAVSQHGARGHHGASAAMSVYRHHVGKGLQATFGPRATFLYDIMEWGTMFLPLGIVFGAYWYLRKDAAIDFSLYSEVLLLAHIYFTGYWGVISIATMLFTPPPLTLFAALYPLQYVAYQVLMFILTFFYVLLVVYHFVLATDAAEARLQLAGTAVVFLHSYLGVVHPAIHSAIGPQVTVWGFLAYTVCFASMAGMHTRERSVKKD